MTTLVATCTPDDFVDSLSALMTEKRVRHVPVVVNGRLAGIVSIGDVVKTRMEELEAATGTAAALHDPGPLILPTGIDVRPSQKADVRRCPERWVAPSTKTRS